MPDRSTAFPDGTVPKGFSSFITTEPVSNVELGALSALLALLVLLLARVVHLLLLDHTLIRTYHRHPNNPSYPRLVSIKDENCNHDVSAQASSANVYLRNNKPTPKSDFAASASSIASSARDLVEDNVRKGVEMVKEMGQAATDFGDAWSGELLAVPDEEEAYHSCGSGETATKANHRWSISLGKFTST